MRYLTLFSLLLTITCHGQTWPTKDCPDRPYIKGDDGIIYHTCDCGIMVSKSGFMVASGSTVWTTESKSPLEYCPLCGYMCPHSHLERYLKEGELCPGKDKDDHYLVNKYFNPQELFAGSNINFKTAQKNNE